MAIYVAHLSREEVKLFLPLEKWLIDYAALPTEKEEERKKRDEQFCEFLQKVVDDDKGWSDYVPTKCIVDAEALQLFAFWLVGRLEMM